MAERRKSVLSSGQEEDDINGSRISLESSVEPEVLIEAFKLLEGYTVTNSKLGSVTTFEFKNDATGEVHRAVADEEKKTFGFIPPFNSNIISAYTASVLEKTPDTILQISSCEDFATLKAFFDTFKISEASNQVTFYIPPALKTAIIKKEAESLKTGDAFADAKNAKQYEDQAIQKITSYLASTKLEATPDAVAALRAKRQQL